MYENIPVLYIAHTHQAVWNFYTSENPQRKASLPVICLRLVGTHAIETHSLFCKPNKEFLCYDAEILSRVYPGLPLFQTLPAAGA
jgi:hypothetical protein